jgi:C_GCAxxG_C_C family probable redox protein
MESKRPDDVEAAVRRGLEIFDQGLSCAESVTTVGMERLGRSSDLVPRIATGFAGGVSRTRSLCGALAGGVLVLGAAYGRDRLGDDRSRLQSEVQALVGLFRERFGSDNCYALTGLDFNTLEGMDAYKAKVHDQCRTYVAMVIETLCAQLPPR